MSMVVDAGRPDLGGNMRHGDPHTWAPKIWRYLREFYAMRSMLDVGCGEGHAVAFFQRMGVQAHGIDGLLTNVHRSVVPIAHHDLLGGAYVMPVDFVWSCEVAEHIAPDKVHHFIQTLANAPVVGMTHAVPGQGGHNHVNCQPAAYWVELMRGAGFHLHKQNDHLRYVSSQDDFPNYFANTGLLFIRD